MREALSLDQILFFLIFTLLLFIDYLQLSISFQIMKWTGTHFFTEKLIQGLPWWLSRTESTYQGRRPGFYPWPRKTPHAAEERSPCATTAEPKPHSNYWSPRAREPGCTTRDATASRSPHTTARERCPLSASREKPVQHWRPSAAEYK